MNYIATREAFVKIDETSGTIQNLSKFLSVEVSNVKQQSTGFVVPPMGHILFDASPLYVRCANGRRAEVRCVPFDIRGATGGDAASGDAATFTAATDAEITEMLDNNFGKEK